MFSISLPAKFDAAAVDRCQQLLQRLDQLASEPYNAASTRETAQQLSSCIGALDSAAKSSLVTQKAVRRPKGLGINELVEKALVGLINSAVRNGDFASAKCALDSVKWLCCDKADAEARIEANLAVLATTDASEFAFHAITELVGKLRPSAEQQQRQQEEVAAAEEAAEDRSSTEEQGQVSAALCAACECVGALAHAPGVSKKLAQMDACEVVVSLLEADLVPTEAKLAACATLNSLCSHDPARIRVAQNGGSNRLLQRVAEHARQNSKLAAEICSVLVQLLRHPANQEALYQADAIPVIAGLLETCLEDANMLAALSTVVMRFCEGTKSYQQLFSEAGACATITQALGRHANRVTVVKEALGALVNLCVVSEVAERAAELGGDIAVLRALDASAEDSLVVMRAGLMLSQACHLAGRTAALIAADGCRIVTEALARQTDDALVVESLCWTITLFASDDTDDNVRAWGPRALEAVNQALQRQLVSFQPHSSRACAGACLAVAKLTEQTGMSDETVCQNVWKALVSQGHDQQVFFAVCAAMRDLCRDPEHARWFIGQGVLDKVGRTMQKLVRQQMFQSGNPTAAVEQALTLWFRLAGLPETRTYVTQHNELLGVLRQVAERHVNDLQLSFHVCDVVAALTTGSAQLSEMCGAAGLCACVVRILERHYQDESDAALIVSVASVAIRCLAFMPANQVLLNQAGACQLLPAALVRHAQDDSTAFQCLQAMHMLAKFHAENTLLLGRSGGCEAVLQVFTSGIEHPAIAEGCLRTISVLCYNNAVNAERFYEARISQLLLRAFQLHMEVSGTMIGAIAAIANMCTGTEAARVNELGEAGLCLAVVAAFATHLRSRELVETASVAIVRMCTNGDAINRQRFLEGDALRVLQAAQELYECESIDQAIQLVGGATTNTKLLHD